MISRTASKDILTTSCSYVKVLEDLVIFLRYRCICILLQSNYKIFIDSAKATKMKSNDNNKLAIEFRWLTGSQIQRRFLSPTLR